MRLQTRRGRVLRVIRTRPGLAEIEVELTQGGRELAYNYEDLTGPVQEGDYVILNTTAVALGLGTGRYHFVLHIEGQADLEPQGPGHIMKLRYTPYQLRCLAVEEVASPYHKELEAFTSLAGIPVVSASLHSMLPVICLGAKLAGAGVEHWTALAAQKTLRLVYVMTDGAALPLVFSNLVAELRSRRLIDATITVGHAFGGDLEAVNIYSALVAAKEALAAEVIVVCMGPGIVGTGTKYGFTGLEQGEIVNAASILGGIPVAVPRISFADPRPRHQGISHHTLTALGEVALREAIIPLPQLPRTQKEVIAAQMVRLGQRHRVEEVAADYVLTALTEAGLKVTTMGRSVTQERPFFLAAAAAGVLAGRIARANAGGC